MREYLNFKEFGSGTMHLGTGIIIWTGIMHIGNLHKKFQRDGAAGRDRHPLERRKFRAEREIGDGHRV